jgi:predicted acyltransferase
VTFNAISSAGTILIGVLAGELLRSSWSSGRKALTLLIGGAALFGAGELMRVCGVPQVKRIWTASFALYAAGWTCWMMCAFYVIIDIVGWRGWAFPFVVVGVNSIFIYVSAGILNGTIQNLLKPFTYFRLQELGPWGPVVLATLVMCVQWLFCLFLYRQRIFFKV